MTISKHRQLPTAFPNNATDEGIDGASQLDTLLNSMDSQGNEQAGDPEAGSADTDPNNDGNSDPGSQDNGGEGSDDPNQDPNNKDPKPDDVANKAFAQMRVQNKELGNANAQMQSVIKAMAKSMGIETESMTEIMDKLNDDAITKQAAAEKVPVEVLKRLKTLEQRDQVYTQAQLKQAANEGFQSIQKEFELSNEELIAFAQDLDTQGLNPYAVQDVNIREKFVATNLTKIIDRKVQAALQRAAKGDTHSSTPGDKSGGSGETKKISSVAGLTAMLNSVDL